LLAVANALATGEPGTPGGTARGFVRTQDDITAATALAEASASVRKFCRVVRPSTAQQSKTKVIYYNCGGAALCDVPRAVQGRNGVAVDERRTCFEIWHEDLLLVRRKTVKRENNVRSTIGQNKTIATALAAEGRTRKRRRE
jgi:hypothetical protein